MGEQMSLFFDLQTAALDWGTASFIPASAIKLTSQRSFSQGCPTLTMNGGQPWVIKATIGMIGPNVVYLDSWFCYEFVYVFKSSLAAEKFYAQKLKEIMDEKPHNSHGWKKELDVQLPPVDIYRCPDGKTLSCKGYYDHQVRPLYSQKRGA